MLSTWCEWHPYARKFLLGVAHLNMGEEEKALDLFISGAGGIPQDQFLTQDLLELQGSTPADLTVEYFLKVTSKDLTKKIYCMEFKTILFRNGWIGIRSEPVFNLHERNNLQN